MASVIDPTPIERFWRGITQGHLYDIQKAMGEGVRLDALSPPGVKYRPSRSNLTVVEELPAGIRPLEALFLCHPMWDGPPETCSDFRKISKVFVRGTEKEFFSKSLLNGQSVLGAYSALPYDLQKSNVFEMVLRRTPTELLDAQDHKGDTPLHHLIRRLRKESFGALIKAGASPNIFNAEHRNAVLEAAATRKSSNRSHVHPVEFLKQAVDAGGRVDVADSRGRNVLFLCDYLTFGQFEKMGGDLYARDHEDRSIVDVFLANGNLSRLSDLLKTPGLDARRMIPDRLKFSNRLNDAINRYGFSGDTKIFATTLDTLAAADEASEIEANTVQTATRRAKTRL